ncbi:MAG: tRNA (adenosine(37)-N6)-threonylcarbamoyltransferase complex transferase subunit TsaD [Candidatus Omnitrophica bacterium]|nr:tRNA (adenosine(37)-N6)-threonylcarbamoyltransferase complex transferase subunit TsaD [Candidatus Omnitrophota bacterium]
MLTLGIETSCDETSCAVLAGTSEIKSNIVASSLARHQPFGGVVPEIASRHCLEAVGEVYAQAMKQARVRPGDLDLIAVTKGPGLIGSLLVGVCFAKTLSYQLGIPLVGVNHLEAHLAANFIGRQVPRRYLGLLVSGGHTSLSLTENSRMFLLGETVDDACGEAYDKVAKLLELGYPGGPIIDKLASQGDPKAFSFTRPKLKRPFDFSFSGIKTAVLYLVRKQGRLSADFKRDLSASFQNAVAGWLVEKTLSCAEANGLTEIFAGGGVTANSELRSRLEREASDRNLKIGFPPMPLTGDNGAMIARRGIDHYEQKRFEALTLTGMPGLAFDAAC